jgi:prepilin-type N-terminal cleavage/methylation domain-containing protein
MKNKTFTQKLAFTLAEVLITLGIIGVVAALTLPSVITNYRKSEIETGFRKSFNTLTNAIELSKIDNGAMSTWAEGDITPPEFWNIYLQPYLKDAKLCTRLNTCPGYSKVDQYKWHGNGSWNIMTSNDGDRLVFQLKDGTVVFWKKCDKSLATSCTNFNNFIFVDVNGSRGPNTGGVDVFYLTRNYKTNKLVAPEPVNGKDCSTTVTYCAYELINNNWKFPKDYPRKI